MGFFENAEARAAYLNIVAASLGFVGAGATTALTQCVSRGVQIGVVSNFFKKRNLIIDV